MSATELSGIVGLRDAGPSRACDLIADQLRELIVSRRLPSGSRLPSERELARQFQTSRATISQALRILAAQDLVEIAHGRGVFVSPEPTRLLRSTFDLMLGLTRQSMLTLVQLRGWIEVAAIERAAEARTEADLERIARAFEAMHGERTSVVAWLSLDGEFHKAIVEATGNTYATTVLAGISDLMFSARQRAYSEAATPPGWFAPGEFRRLMRVHRKILDAVRAGSSTAAREAGLEHQRLLERNVAAIDPWRDAGLIA